MFEATDTIVYSIKDVDVTRTACASLRIHDFNMQLCFSPAVRVRLQKGAEHLALTGEKNPLESSNQKYYYKKKTETNKPDWVFPERLRLQGLLGLDHVISVRKKPR